MNQIQIPFDNSDAEGFKNSTQTIIRYLIQTFDPSEVSIIRIKNWFDHKWLHYSGKQILKYDTKSNPSIPFVLEPYWNTEITIPPFHPNRVLSELKFRKKNLNSSTFLEPFHKVQSTTENKDNLIARRTHNGICIWISSNSAINRQGSLMVYQIKNSEVQSWYISIEEKDVWKVTKTKDISRKEVKAMLASASTSENY